MRFFRTEVWSYAVLLIILFSIATLAVWHILGYLEEQILIPREFRVVTILMWTLTLGFMMIAGAFGLWAIQFAGEAEARRRIGRFVDAMDYISDGLLATDAKGHIRGSNPASKEITGAKLEKSELIKNVFHCLSNEDVKLLLNKKEPYEVERKFTRNDITRALRFRSQPSEDLMLIMISDVSKMETQRFRSRQRARLQLIGQIARGVVNDFDTLLNSISNHASLLSRTGKNSPDAMKSVQAITQGTEKGITLARNLLALAETGTTGQSTEMIHVHINAAVDILRNTLSADWKVRQSITDQLPAVALSGIQIEQVVINLGLLASDALKTPGTINITAAKTKTDNQLLNVSEDYAGVIIVSAGDDTTDTTFDIPTLTKDSPRTSGVIQSVIRSMLMESGGDLDCLTTPDKSPLYRVLLPHELTVSTKEDTGELPSELKTYIASWKVLLAQPQMGKDLLYKRLMEVKTNVTRANSITTVLANMEENKDIDAMILDEYLLEHETKGLLKAILRLCPTAGIVVLCEDPNSAPEELTNNVIFESNRSNPDKILASMIESKTLTARRKSV
ncbi:hypothetical protein ACFLS1_00495 [Verrucomicrobiota bacterium]